MKLLKFTFKDAVAAFAVAAFVTLILLDRYLLGGLDSYIVAFFGGLAA